MRLSIWRRNFWRFYWIALRRSWQDKRARGAAVRVSLLFAGCFAIAVLFSASIPYLGVGLAGFVTGYLRQRKRRAATLRSGAKHLTPELRNYLEERAGILASLLARGGSEVYLRHKELPPGAQVVTRQIQNGFLKQTGLWQSLEQPEMELVIAADGGWTQEQRGSVIAWCEQLRLLRWAIGVDRELIPLAHFPGVDFSLSRDFFGRKTLLRSRKSSIAADELVQERDLALQYMARVVAEMDGRGMMTMEGEVWKQFREAAAGPSTDYLAGLQTVGELSSDALVIWARLRLRGSVTLAGCWSNSTRVKSLLSPVGRLSNR
jgi:hypothetical protein